MKPTELRMSVRDEGVVEVWYDGALIGEVSGTVGPGVRLVSHHRLQAAADENAFTKRVEIRIAYGSSE